MHDIRSRNVNDAYQKGMRLLTEYGVREQSRAGDVLVMPSPVVNVYHAPNERVLLDADRDANPFFHLFEAIWMIAGRRDATWLDMFVSDFSSRYAEDDGNAHGAYGYRWRRHWLKEDKDAFCHDCGERQTDGYVDQLMESGRLLRENPASRQVVMAMWDPAADLGAGKRDIPCNDLVMFRGMPPRSPGVRWTLDMTLVARSHDAVWGAYGANAVHMSFMHEVVAGLADMDLGRYIHFSNNFHVYTSILPKLGSFPVANQWRPDFYEEGRVAASPLCVGTQEALDFVRDCEEFCAQGHARVREEQRLRTRWFLETALPMYGAFVAHREGNYGLRDTATKSVGSSDWRLAAQQWFERRDARRQRREEAGK